VEDSGFFIGSKDLGLNFKGVNTNYSFSVGLSLKKGGSYGVNDEI